MTNDGAWHGFSLKEGLNAEQVEQVEYSFARLVLSLDQTILDHESVALVQFAVLGQRHNVGDVIVEELEEALLIVALERLHPLPQLDH